jgi:hypothetical protein
MGALAHHRTLPAVRRHARHHGASPHWSRIFGNAVQPADAAAAVSAFLRRADAPLLPARARIVGARAGKTWRGTIPRGSTRGVPCLAAARPADGVVLAQVAFDQQEKEHGAARVVLRHRDLPGVLVTGEALLAQRSIRIPLVEARAE